jgi:hypothetical protein
LRARTREQPSKIEGQISPFYFVGQLTVPGIVAAIGESLASSRLCGGSSPATPRSLAASNRSERENVYGNQEIQQYEEICSEEKFQQEEVEHQKI